MSKEELAILTERFIEENTLLDEHNKILIRLFAECISLSLKETQI